MFFKKRVTILEANLVTAEKYLTYRAAIPVIGTIPALIKLALGALQIVGGLLTLIASPLFLITGEARQAAFHAVRHIFHGIANVISGLLLAIPIVGSMFAAWHIDRDYRSSSYDGYSNTQSGHFVGYRKVDRNWIKAIDHDQDEPTLKYLKDTDYERAFKPCFIV